MRKTSLLLLVLLCGFAAAGSAAAQTVTPVKLFIDPSFAGNLHSDGKGAPAGTYIDNRVLGGDICVNALLSAGAVGKVRINMDFNPNISGDCDVVEFKLATAGRSYGLTFQSAAICNALGFGAVSTCTLMPDQLRRPFIQADTLFGTGGTTVVEFQFYAPNGNYYQLQTDIPAGVTGSGATRTAAYYGTATLSLGSAKIGSTSFPFSFTVTKCTTSGCP